MSAEKMKTCASCGAEIAKSAKVCPKCGAKNKKPIYLRPWFIVLIVVVLLVLFSSGSDESSNSGTNVSSGNDVQDIETETQVEYIPYNVSELVNDLDNNAMAASEKYKDQYVELTGKLQVIDSSGSYISINPENDEITFTNVQCYIMNEEQKDVIKTLSKGDLVIVTGKITDVGEVLGYSLDIDSIEAK